jgi:hypothetical protein
MKPTLITLWQSRGPMELDEDGIVPKLRTCHRADQIPRSLGYYMSPGLQAMDGVLKTPQLLRDAGYSFREVIDSKACGNRGHPTQQTLTEDYHLLK